MENAIFDLVTQSEDSAQAALAICNAFESLDNKSWDLFRGTILEQVKKVFPKAECDEEDKWYYIWIPLKNGKYKFSMNYDWKAMEIRIEDENQKNTSKEARAMHQKMSELTGVTGEQEDDDSVVWLSDEDIVLHPELKNGDENLYFYTLYKYYSEHTKEAAGSIITMAQALENT
jgi:hypothetical protein